MEPWQVAAIVPSVAIIASAATAFFTLRQTGARNKFDALDKICSQQWHEISALREELKELNEVSDRLRKDVLALQRELTKRLHL